MIQPDTGRAGTPLPYRQVAGGVVGAALLAVLALAGALPAHAHPGGRAADGCHVNHEIKECHCHQASGDQTSCPGVEQTEMPPVPEGYIRIASWNLALAKWMPARTDEDYPTLADYARRLNADIIAFQEVNSLHAAKRIFPPRNYSLFFSGRYDPQKDDIYNGFAVRKGRFGPSGVKRERDYKELGLGKHSGLRWGVDLTVHWKERTLRLLNVHLKARCRNESLQDSPDRHCRKLARQFKPLEEWIDERWREKTPFVVLGDFNRELDRHRDGKRDPLWNAIDDGEPSGLRLHRLPPPERMRPCWREYKERYHRYPIDFFVFGDRAWQWVDKASFREQTWDDKDTTDANADRKFPSDHCPIAVDLF